METENGTDPVVFDTSTEVAEPAGGPGPDSSAGETPAQQPTGINPAWAPIRDVLGEDLFDVNVAPHLQKFDEAAQTRITNLTSELKGFEGYKSFVEQGISPDAIEQAMQIRQLLESNPQEVYARLGEYFGQGQESQEEGLENFGAGQENAAEVPPHLQAQLDQLTQFQQQVIQQQQEAQMQAQQNAAIEEAGAQLDKDMDDFLNGNTMFSAEDRSELFRIQHELTLMNERKGLSRMATPAEAGQVLSAKFAEYRQRFGGGAGAPSVISPTAGGDIQPSAPDVGKLSKQGMAELIENDLRAAAAARQS